MAIVSVEQPDGSVWLKVVPDSRSRKRKQRTVRPVVVFLVAFTVTILLGLVL